MAEEGRSLYPRSDQRLAMDRLYVSNKNESVRMFKSDFMEFCSHVHPITPVVLYLRSSSTCFMRPCGGMLSPFLQLPAFSRWSPDLDAPRVHHSSVHFPLRAKDGMGKTAALHCSRRAPRLSHDATRLVMPPSVSVPLAVVFWVVFALILDVFAPAISAGLPLATFVTTQFITPRITLP